MHALTARDFPVKLLVIGANTDEEYFRELTGLATDLSISDRVIFTGYTKPAATIELLKKSDVCIFPFEKGASLGHTTLVTALILGVPTVTTVVPANLPDELVDQHNVMLFQPGDLSGLVDRVLTLLEQPGLRERIGQNAGALAHSFSWEEIAKKTKRVYEQSLHIGIEH